ncbi:MAG TPA: hypothetical protein VMC61_03825 [Methanocella sp.]|nr:hypothetical protein [Methanocella sp.]
MALSSNKAAFLLLVGMLAMCISLPAFAGLPANAQTSPIAPNGIAFVSEANTLTAGNTYNITVQILYNGGPLNSEGVRVYMLANDTSIIPAELGTFVLTDKDGVAIYTATPKKAGVGKLTAMAMSAKSGVSADKKYQIIIGPVATPTPTATAVPSPTPTPSATVTAVPSAEPTPTATPSIAPTITAAPTAAPGDANAQAISIITASIVIAIILIVFVLIVRVFRKK